MMSKNILLLCGGGSEHKISLISAQFFEQLRLPFKLYKVVIEKNGSWLYQQKKCQLKKKSLLIKDNQSIDLDFVIPCLHGYPGETGDIALLLEKHQLPFLGSSFATCVLCFDKVATKQFVQKKDILVTPYLVLKNLEQKHEALKFLEKFGQIMVKPACQGSSIGCHYVEDVSKLNFALKDAFCHSSQVLVEQFLKARELEVAVYNYKGQLYVTRPGEIICQERFYDYKEKYDKQSSTKLEIVAKNIDTQILEKINMTCRILFEKISLRHLARIDFFLDRNNLLYFNEINTFPGHTKISLFPRMMENNSLSYKEFLEDIIERETA